MYLSQLLNVNVTDGGGVRGISSLYILQAILAKVSAGNPSVRPCEYFDMICGTSTGGYIIIHNRSRDYGS